MEGTSEVKGKRKRTRPPRGAARRAKRLPATPIHSKSDVKRFSYAWRKASPYGRSPAKWAWAAAPCPSG